jgi:hypothetical protein
MTPAEQKYRALHGATKVHAGLHRSRGAFTFALVGGTFAILIWMKLRVVGGVPRTAYADPEDRPAPAKAPLPTVTPSPKPQQMLPETQVGPRTEPAVR